MESVYHFEWNLRASPRALWPYVSDTQRLNQALGLAPWQFTEFRNDGGNVGRTGEMRFAGMPIRWEEKPFEWVAGSELGVERHYKNGPLSLLRSTVRLEASGDGTLLKHSVAYEPRGAMWSLVARYELGRKTKRNLNAVYRRIDAYLAGEEKQPFQLKPPRIGHEVRAWLDALVPYLAIGDGFPEALVRRLTESIVVDDDRTLARLRPFEIADRWGEDRTDVLRLLLRATRRRLLQMHWDVLCPHCRKAKVRLEDLGSLRAVAHCEACDIRVDTDVERAVELVFSVTPAVRPIEVHDYCIGGPGNTPHVVVQRRVPAGERSVVAIQLDPGTYRLRALGVANHLLITTTDDANRKPPAQGGLEAVLRKGTLGPPEATLRSDGASIEIVNRESVERVVLLERADWFDDAVSVGRAMAFQEFRDLFPHQAPPRAARVRVEQVGVVSLRLGFQAGLAGLDDDEAALAVRDVHLRIRHVVRRRRGAVSTVRREDVIVTFADATDAVRAAAELVATVARFAAERRLPGLEARAGIDAGPCSIVNRDGHAMHEGAPLERSLRHVRLAGANEVVLPRSLRNEPRMARTIAEQIQRSHLAAMPIDAGELTSTDRDATKLERLIVPRVQAPAPAAAATPVGGGSNESNEVDLNELEIGDRLGRGGSGSVFEGRTRDGRRYAVKIIEARTDKAETRFQREVHALRRLVEVPGVVVLRASGRHPKAGFVIVMDLIRGRSLEEHVAAGRKPVVAAAAIAATVARALAHAHRLGVVHRDVKPANVILDANDEPFLVDFGISKADADADITVEGTVVGTVPYLPPEAFNHRAVVDGRGDIWGLGATFFELITGRRPFIGHTIYQIIPQILQDPLPPPSSLVPGLDAGVDAVLLRALAKRPEDRYETAEAFAVDLERLTGGASPVHAAGLPLPSASRRWRRLFRSTAEAPVPGGIRAG